MFMVIMVNLICDDFVVLFNEILGGENEGFEGCVVKGIVIVIENDMVVIDGGQVPRQRRRRGLRCRSRVRAESQRCRFGRCRDGVRRAVSRG